MRKIITILLILLTFNAIADSGDKSSFYSKTYQNKALEIYKKVISFRSAAGHGQVLEMAEYLASEFGEGGFSKQDIHLLPVTSSDGEKIAALVVRYKGDSSSNKKPILLMAHMDVVEALPKDWQRSPFKLVEEDGYFFGRGMIDNKFGITMLTSLFLRLKAEGFVPTRDLIIAFSGDEETSQKTTELMYTKYLKLTNAEFALNSDDGGGVLSHEKVPTSYSLAVAEKGYASFELTVRNPGGHSSAPRLDNAIYELADALKKVQAYRFPVRSTDMTQEYFAKASILEKGKLAETMKRFAENPNDKKAADFLYTQPGLVGMTRTTCIATMLTGGHAENALPQSAMATINCRIFPGEDANEVKIKLQSIVGGKVEVKALEFTMMASSSTLPENVKLAVTKAIHSQYPGIPVVPTMVPWGTDGLHTRKAGIPTFGVTGVFVRDEDSFTHGLNERVPVKSFYKGLEHWHVLIHELAGNNN